MASKRPLQSAESRKLCVVCYGDDVYPIFFMDLDISGGAHTCTDFIDKNPSLIINSSIGYCFCVLDSSLYIIDASPPPFEPPIDPYDDSPIIWGPLRRYKMFKLDLGPHIWDWDSDSPIQVVELDEPGYPFAFKSMKSPKLDLEYIPSPPYMKSPKLSLVVIPTPDGGKMVAFSQYIRYYTSRDDYDCEYEEAEDPDFEIFDPKSQSWKSLPQLVLLVSSLDKDKQLFYLYNNGNWIEHSGTKDHGPYYEKGFYPLDGYRFSLQAGTFINNNTFLVGLPIGAMFTLNIDKPQEGWKRYQVVKFEPGRDWFLLPREEVILNPYVVKRRSVSHRVRSRWHDTISMDCTSQTLSILDNTEDRCIACNVVTGADESLRPYIACDLYSIDLSLVTPPACVGSFNYSVSGRKFFPFSVSDVFPFMAIESLEEEQAKRPKITES